MSGKLGFTLEALADFTLMAKAEVSQAYTHLSRLNLATQLPKGVDFGEFLNPEYVEPIDRTVICATSRNALVVLGIIQGKEPNDDFESAKALLRALSASNFLANMPTVDVDKMTSELFAEYYIPTYQPGRHMVCGWSAPPGGAFPPGGLVSGAAYHLDQHGNVRVYSIEDKASDLGIMATPVYAASHGDQGYGPPADVRGSVQSVRTFGTTVGTAQGTSELPGMIVPAEDALAAVERLDALPDMIVDGARRWRSTEARGNFAAVMNAAAYQPQIVERDSDDIIVMSRSQLAAYAKPKSAGEIMDIMQSMLENLEGGDIPIGPDAAPEPTVAQILDGG